MQPPVLQFAAAVIKHWKAFVTGGLAAALLSFLPGIGRALPHWVYWLVFRGIGWVAAFYRAWLDEHQEVGRLKQELDGESTKQKREGEKRELIEVITALRDQKNKVLYWRDVARDKWGMELEAEKLELNDLPSTLHWAGKIGADFQNEVTDFENKISGAERLLKQFLKQSTTFRQQDVIRQCYTLLDEALPHLDKAIGEFERFEGFR